MTTEHSPSKKAPSHAQGALGKITFLIASVFAAGIHSLRSARGKLLGERALKYMT